MKLVKFGVVGLFACVLIACQDTSPKSTVCENETSKVEIDSKGDKATLQKTEATYTLESFGLTAETADSDLTAAFQKMNATPGIKMEHEIDGENLILKTEVNYEKADLKKLAELELIESSHSSDKIDYISVKETVKGLEAQGLTCKTK